jgi:hypothetical protein
VRRHERGIGGCCRAATRHLVIGVGVFALLIALSGVQLVTRSGNGTARAEVYTCGQSGDSKGNYFDGKVDANDSDFYNYKCRVLSNSNNGNATRADGEKWFIVTPSCPGFNIYTDTAG